MSMRKPLRVLVVEDDKQLAEHIRQDLLMEDGRISAETATTLADAMDRIKRGGINAMIVDLTLPDASGLDAVTTLKAAHPEVPMVVLTGAAGNLELEGGAMEAGAEDYLEKPVQTKLLIHALRHADLRHEANMKFEEIRRGMAETEHALKAAEEFKERLTTSAERWKKTPPPGAAD